MSLQDESFPDESFLKELEFSFNQGRLYQFPNRRKCSAYKKTIITSENAIESTTATITPPPTNTNTSASSAASSSDQPNLSTESVADQHPSESSDKTEASDGVKAEIVDEKPESHFQSNRQCKAVSYHDIHNEYTKRRYRHVESKVGQYIASIKAEEQKRRAKFQRHKSMPTSLTATMVHASDSTEQFQPPQQQRRSLRHSTTDLHKLNESATSDVDAETANSSQHTNGMTHSANTSSSQGGATISSAGGGSHTTSRHESSDEALNGADFIDKLAYAQLVEEKEYIEMKLKEKSSENVRLKRNVDYMRIELSNCQDKLKRLSSSSNLSIRSSLMGYSYCGSGSSVDALGRYPYSNPLQYSSNTAVNTKATQTDFLPAILRTPIPSSLKPDGNSSAGDRTSGINGNILRQRTNSNCSAQKLKGAVANCTRPKYPSSTDTGFNSHCTNLSTTKSKSRKILSSSMSSPDPSPNSSPSPSHSPSPSPTPCKQLRPTRRGDEYTYHDRRSTRYAPVAVLNASDESDVVFDENESNCNPTAVTTSNAAQRGVNRRHRSSSLRHRLMRLLGRCTRCDDPNQTLDGYGDAIQMTQSPTPLLNTRDSENGRRNLR